MRHTRLIPFKQIAALPARQIQHLQIPLRHEFPYKHGLGPVVEVAQVDDGGTVTVTGHLVGTGIVVIGY